ncbi:hypothetical protein GCM10011507_24530 [Edaphobacter acidisoli]|uniref:Lipoprotein n=1 Tax=Edaphobacter acidisoli TaxID=2040573 RepID=A0A916RVF2_9BACT|nr:hypothetical protein GCM10011507_24530 [Edaphobacter acidisoli]
MSLKLRYFAVTAVLFVALACTFERQAYAYVDPGSSLLIFQTLSALVTGALFYLRRRIKALFTRQSASNKSAE